MSTPDTILAMREALGGQLAALRREAGLTQEELATRMGFSRSSLSVAEIGRQAFAREFWAAGDKALRTGGVLAAGFGQIEAVRHELARAAAQAAQQAREAQALAALKQARAGGLQAAVTAVQACPYCRRDVAVLTTLVPAPAGPAAPPAGR
jgi:transcriptional regulator with XRE-family HTH domain